MKVYVAGPIGAKNNAKSPLLESLDNIRKGIRASVKVLLAGHIPFCPFLDHLFWSQLKGNEQITERMIKNYSLEWLKCCDAMIVLPGWQESQGTLDEMVVAKREGITIYHGVRVFLDSHK